MTKVLCKQEKCSHNKEWVCDLDLLKMRVEFNEPTPFEGWDSVECAVWDKNNS